MEYWDLYDASRRPLGRTHRRGQPLPDGAFFTAVAIWVVNSRREVLLTLRDPAKESWAGYWENTGGAVQAGETSLQAAVRELREETGIHARPEQLCFLGTSHPRHCFMDIYAVRADVPLDDIVLQQGETADAQWVSLERLDQMAATGQLARPIVQRLHEMRERLESFIG